MNRANTFSVKIKSLLTVIKRQHILEFNCAQEKNVWFLKFLLDHKGPKNKPHFLI